jgi:hypothetical protein
VADEFAGYAAWYSWARTSVADDAIVCHTAAAAAMHTLTLDGDVQAAAAAARAAAREETARARSRARYGPPYQYVEWFIWARDNLGLPDALCHEAARTALESLSAGGSPAGAAEAAIRVMLPPASSAGQHTQPTLAPGSPSHVATPLPPPPSSTTTRIVAGQFTRDAFASIVFGIASIAIPLVLPVYFPVLPFVGFWRGVVAIRNGRVAGGVVGLVHCAAGCLTSLLASGLLNVIR